MISSDCCFLSSCIDLDDVDLRSSLLHFVGISNDHNTKHNSDNNDNDIELEEDADTATNKYTDNYYHQNRAIYLNHSYETMKSRNDSKNNKRRTTFNNNVPKLNYSFSSKTKSNLNHSKTKQTRNAPPPVIALSRSSFSTNSDSSGSSSLEATQFEHDHLDISNTPSYSIYNTTQIKNSNHDPIHHDYHHNHDDEEECNVNCYSVRNNYYEGQHELLINSLFEDAKRRQEELLLLEQQQHQVDNELHDEQNGDSIYHTPPRRTSTSHLFSDNKSIASKTSKYSSKTSNSNKSNTSELLTPASHKFQKSLRTNMMNIRGVIGLHRFQNNGNNKNNRRLLGGRKRTKNHYFRRLKRNQSDSTQSRGRHVHHHRHSRYNNHHHLHPSDFSACSGSMTTSSPYSHPSSTSSPTNNTSSPTIPNIQSFLDINVKLQKDSGKGKTIGQSISANGRENALKKLNDKMDILAEVDRDDKWSKATLTRVPAKNMTDYYDHHHHPTDSRNAQHGSKKGYIETRSMLAVKLGFVTLKYGILVHWNASTGLAELILLRKSCPESFMKGSSSQSSIGGDGDGKKKKNAWNKKRTLTSRAVMDGDLDDSSLHATPSFVSISSEGSSDDDSLGIEHVGSAHF